jgi:hypothetical protein
MAYVLRGEDGFIIAASPDEKPADNWESISNSDDDYLEFLERQLKKYSEFRESDIQLARVLEDLINILVDRNLIQFTEFPSGAQKRLNSRQSLRKTSLSSLMDDEPLI